MSSPVVPVGTQPPIPQPDPALFQAPLVPVGSAPEKKLKVMLYMGDDRPRFEVRDGEECYLKVVCDKVDVKSPSDRGESMSVMKATGKVTFVTPGGEGECEELSVVPGTGQVIVSGKVTVKHTWGKAETTFSCDRVTFRLGSAPRTRAGDTAGRPRVVPAALTISVPARTLRPGPEAWAVSVGKLFRSGRMIAATACVDVSYSYECGRPPAVSPRRPTPGPANPGPCVVRPP